MLGNYKKIAIINTSERIRTTSKNTHTWRRWSLSLSFNPNLIIMAGKNTVQRSFRAFTIISTRDTENALFLYQNSSEVAQIAIRNLTSSGFEYLFETTLGSGTEVEVNQIIAIG